MACLPEMVLVALSGFDDEVDEFVGVKGGSSFNDKYEGKVEGQKISTIRVWVDGENHTSSIQIQYGNVWGNPHGGSKGEKFEATLRDGETLLKVQGSTSEKGIASLKFIGSKSDYGPYGSVITTSQWTSEDPGCHIIYISGRADEDRIKSLEFHYSCDI